VKQKRKARIGINPKTQQKIKDSSQNCAEIPSREGGKGRGSRGKEGKLTGGYGDGVRGGWGKEE
jgi:hypothetical protein